MDPIIGTGISALANIGSSIINNRAQRKLSMDMYNLQRRDALADWERQVAYESPAQQMARYKEAGLNPFLIYGQNQSAPSVRSTPMDVPQLQRIQLPDFGESILRGQQLKNMQATEDKTQLSMDLMNQEKALNNLEQELRIIEIATKGLDLSQRQKLYDDVIQRYKIQNQGIALDNTIKGDIHTGKELDNRFKRDTYDNRVKLTAADLAHKNASIAEVVQRTTNMREMLPYQKREAEQRIQNLFQSTEGKKLSNFYDKMTMADRITTNELIMEITGGNLSKQEIEKSIMGFEELLRANDVNMMGVDNVKKIVGVFRDALIPFALKGGLDKGGQIINNRRSSGGYRYEGDPASNPPNRGGRHYKR